jgi:HAD superfamily hydrolase (TIGR01450 family)
MSEAIPRIAVDRLIERYDAILLDAYGVLIAHDGALPGAGELIRELNAREKPYLILTNDASRSPATSSRRYASMGVGIPPDRILSSGLLIAPYFEENGLRGLRTVVLGPPESHDMVRDAGGEVVPLDARTDAEVLVVCDEAGFPFLETLDRALSFLVRRFDRGQATRLIVANPDLVYPASPGRYGFTGGALALLLERGLASRYPGSDLRFDPLGKPHPRMFAEGVRRLGTRHAVMIGDQLGTDIAGAIGFGLDAALVTSGLARGLDGASCLPTYLLEPFPNQPWR